MNLDITKHENDEDGLEEAMWHKDLPSDPIVWAHSSPRVDTLANWELGSFCSEDPEKTVDRRVRRKLRKGG